MDAPMVAWLMPRSGAGIRHYGAAEAYYQHCTESLPRLYLRMGTSMLPRTFNYLWCDARRERKNHPLKLLGMIHDDVAPEPGCLDILYSEMQRVGADMISAVIPIKNDLGVTSTAVDNPDDPYSNRRLCMKEVFNLPETFEAKDIPWRKEGQCLLANTGLFLMRFDQPWVDEFPGFRFQNSIRNQADGDCNSIDIPEDWDFSRWMASKGLKVFCTRKVKLEHELPIYHNTAPWGAWPTDLNYLLYERQKRDPGNNITMKFPEDVEGWLSPQEGYALARLAHGKKVLEIGSYCGRSTICLAQHAEKVTSVDPFDGRATTKPQETLGAFIENLVRYGLIHKVDARKGCAAMVVPGLEGPFDLAFIDGAHDFKNVMTDAALATEKLTSDGLLAFHDYNRPGDEGVTAAVDKLVADGAQVVEVSETIAVLRPVMAA